jgi:hypothetical protein
VRDAAKAKTVKPGKRLGVVAKQQRKVAKAPRKLRPAAAARPKAKASKPPKLATVTLPKLKGASEKQGKRSQTDAE